MVYEHRKQRRLLSHRRREHLPQSARKSGPQRLELIRSTEEERQSQLKRLAKFQKVHEKESGPMLQRPSAGRDPRPERLRRPRGRGAGRFAGPDHAPRCSRWEGSTGVTCTAGARGNRTGGSIQAHSNCTARRPSRSHGPATIARPTRSLHNICICSAST